MAKHSANFPTSGLNPAALAIGDMAKLLTKVAGAPVSPDYLAADIAAGAPTNPDGTLHLIKYAAWLLARRTREEYRDAE